MGVLQLVVSGITIGMVYGLVALGYHLIFRATGLIDFAQGEKVALGGLFVLEIASVILQVASFKATGRRMFRMAPIHHHFELLGWPEPRVIVRFWIITLILVIVGISTLKLR